MKTHKRGFASMTKAMRTEVARRGGLSSQRSGAGFSFKKDITIASLAGHVGGATTLEKYGKSKLTEWLNKGRTKRKSITEKGSE